MTYGFLDKINLYNYLWILLGISCLIINNIIVIFTDGISYWTADIASHLPIIYWVLMITLLLLPLFYIIFTYNKNCGLASKKTEIILILLSLISVLLIRILPISLGAFTSGYGDTLSHFGYMVDMFNDGFIYNQNPYPGMHTQIVGYSIISGISFITISNYLILLYVILSFMGLFLLARRIFKKRVMVISILSVFPIIPLGFANERLVPNALVCLSILIVAYLVFMFLSKSKYSWRYGILFTLISIFYWYYHPEYVLYSLISLITVFFVIMVYSRLILNSHMIIVSKSKIIYCIFIIVIGFIYIFIQKSVFSGQFMQIYDLLLLSVRDDSQIIIVNEVLMKYDLEIFLIKFLFKYGYYIIFALLVLLYVIYKIFTTNYKEYRPDRLIFISIFFVIMSFSIANIISGTTIGTSISRMFQYPLLISTFILSFYFVDIVLYKNKTILMKILSIIFVSSIIFCLIVSVPSAYGSYCLDKPNYNIVTDSGLSTNKLFFETRNDMNVILETFEHPYQSRYPQFYFGLIKAQSLNNIGNLNFIQERKALSPPLHLGYDIDPYLGNSYDKKAYLIIYPPYGMYTPFYGGSYWLTANTHINDDEYNQLDFDITVSKIIDGGYDYSVYIIS